MKKLRNQQPQPFPIVVIGPGNQPIQTIYTVGTSSNTATPVVEGGKIKPKP